MDAVKNFLHSHDKAPSTEVCTETGPAVTQETVIGHEHVETAEAIDRERHIHHHQHRVQPISDTVHQKEQHETVVAPEVTKEVRAEMAPEKAHLLEGLKAQHKDTRTVGQTEHTASSIGATVQEHAVHHVHEHITPVIQRDTHEHKIVHNVIPVHEKIHEAPIVHESTVLPTVSLDEFKSKLHGEHHGDQTHSHKHFGGEPKSAPGQATEGVIGSHAGAATIDSKVGGHHHATDGGHHHATDGGHHHASDRI